MKAILDKCKAFFSHEVVCMTALVIALAYGFYYLDILDPTQYSLSEIGRHNTALFVVWSVTTGAALILGMHRFYKRIHYFPKAGYITLYVGMACLVATFCNMSREPVAYAFHVATALIFALCAFVSLAIGLLYMMKRNKRYRVLGILFFALILVDVILLAIYTQMALYEFIPCILAYTVFFFTNHTEFFKLDTPAVAEEKAGA